MELKKASGLLVTSKTGHAYQDKCNDKWDTSFIPAEKITLKIREHSLK